MSLEPWPAPSIDWYSTGEAVITKGTNRAIKQRAENTVHDKFWEVRRIVTELCARKEFWGAYKDGAIRWLYQVGQRVWSSIYNRPYMLRTLDTRCSLKKKAGYDQRGDGNDYWDNTIRRTVSSGNIALLHCGRQRVKNKGWGVGQHQGMQENQEV